MPSIAIFEFIGIPIRFAKKYISIVLFFETVKAKTNALSKLSSSFAYASFENVEYGATE